jgi:hypothetical protein
MYNNVYTRNARYATNDSVYITVQNVDAWLLKCISIFTWNGKLDTTRFGPSCIQPLDPHAVPYLPSLNQSEDCLFVNMYVPAGSSTSNKKSVMIWWQVSIWTRDAVWRIISQRHWWCHCCDYQLSSEHLWIFLYIRWLSARSFWTVGSKAGNVMG